MDRRNTDVCFDPALAAHFHKKSDGLPECDVGDALSRVVCVGFLCEYDVPVPAIAAAVLVLRG